MAKKYVPQSFELCRYHFSHSRHGVKEGKNIDRNKLESFFTFIIDYCCSCDEYVREIEKQPEKERKLDIDSDGRDKQGRPYKDSKKYVILYPDRNTEKIKKALGDKKKLVQIVDELAITSGLTRCSKCSHYKPLHEYRKGKA